MRNISKQIRRDIVELLYRKQVCHLGSDLSIVDILVALYFNVMREQDRFILSKGHGAAAFYMVLAEKGYFSKEEFMKEYTDDGTIYLNLANYKVPGVETSTGALGHGLPIAIGVAVSLKNRESDARTFCLISDGELDCGTTWESALFAAHHKLGNLTVIIDNNKIQACGFKKDIINVEPLEDKWLAFGWEVRRIDGHNIEQLKKALTDPVPDRDKPLIIIADTIKGKGIDFAENSVDWHYKNLDDELYKKALKQLL